MQTPGAERQKIASKMHNFFILRIQWKLVTREMDLAFYLTCDTMLMKLSSCRPQENVRGLRMRMRISNPRFTGGMTWFMTSILQPKRRIPVNRRLGERLRDFSNLPVSPPIVIIPRQA